MPMDDAFPILQAGQEWIAPLLYGDTVFRITRVTDTAAYYTDSNDPSERPFAKVLLGRSRAQMTNWELLNSSNKSFSRVSPKTLQKRIRDQIAQQALNPSPNGRKP